MTINDFDYGEFVKCDGTIKYVWDSSDDGDEGVIGLIDENPKMVHDANFDIDVPEVNYYRIEEISKLPEIKVNDDVLKSFFRLETTPWALAKQGLYPFSDETGRFTMTEDDMRVFIANFPSIDSIIYDAWETQYLVNKHVFCEKNDSFSISLRFVWRVMKEIFHWYDPEEDAPEMITDLWSFYLNAKGKPLAKIEVPEMYKNDVIMSICEHAKSEKPTDELVELYKRLLDELCEQNDTWAIGHKAYAYYGGNSVVPCDWKKSEEMLLRLAEYGNVGAANSLGYIYYSDRLGTPDYEKAFHYFSIAADAGIVEAQYKQADMLRKGHGVDKNTDKAFEIYQRLYDSQLESFKDRYYGCKFADVALRMGYCYENGEGVAKNIDAACKYFEIAKDAISKRIKHNKGFGDEVVEKNIDKALMRVAHGCAENESETNTDQHQSLSTAVITSERYNKLYDDFIGLFPEDKEFFKQLELETDAEQDIGMHIMFEMVVVPYVRKIVDEDPKKAKKAFDFFEEMEKDEDPMIGNVVDVSVLEVLIDDGFKKYIPYVGEETLKAARNIAQFFNVKPF